MQKEENTRENYKMQDKNIRVLKKKSCGKVTQDIILISSNFIIFQKSCF